MQGAHIIVSGAVQGVGYRYFAYKRAVELGVKGFAKNLYDGNVEIAAVGERGMIEEFIKQLKIGPRAARVAGVAVEWKNFEEQFDSFDTL